jgi:uncharacterized integral membrane protein
MSRKRVILGIIGLAMFLIFILINSEPANVNFFWLVHTKMPIAIAVIFAFLLGAATAMLFVWFKGKKKEPPLI